jgi:hypothetical protein
MTTGRINQIYVYVVSMANYIHVAALLQHFILPTDRLCSVARNNEIERTVRSEANLHGHLHEMVTTDNTPTKHSSTTTFTVDLKRNSVATYYSDGASHRNPQIRRSTYNYPDGT